MTAATGICSRKHFPAFFMILACQHLVTAALYLQASVEHPGELLWKRLQKTCVGAWSVMEVGSCVSRSCFFLGKPASGQTLAHACGGLSSSYPPPASPEGSPGRVGMGRPGPLGAAQDLGDPRPAVGWGGRGCWLLLSGTEVHPPP